MIYSIYNGYGTVGGLSDEYNFEAGAYIRNIMAMRELTKAIKRY